MAEIAILGATHKTLQQLAAEGQKRFPQYQFIARPNKPGINRSQSIPQMAERYLRDINQRQAKTQGLIYLSSGTPWAQLPEPQISAVIGASGAQHWLLGYDHVWSWNPRSVYFQELIGPWLGHPKLTLLGDGPGKGHHSTTTASDQYLAEQVLGALDDTPGIEQEYKFLITDSSQQLSELPRKLAQCGPIVKVNVSQSYLSPPGAEVERRVRHWSCPAGDFYLYAEKRPGDQGDHSKRQEKEFFISAQRYRELLNSQAPTISKQRYIFLYQGEKWEMDHIGQHWFLELETSGPKPLRPPYRQIFSNWQEVTGQKQWSNRSQAK